MELNFSLPDAGNPMMLFNVAHPMLGESAVMKIKLYQNWAISGRLVGY